MVNLNVTVEYEALKIQADNTSSTISCTTTPGLLLYTYKLTHMVFTYKLKIEIQLTCEMV